MNTPWALTLLVVYLRDGGPVHALSVLLLMVSGLYLVGLAGNQWDAGYPVRQVQYFLDHFSTIPRSQVAAGASLAILILLAISKAVYAAVTARPRTPRMAITLTNLGSVKGRDKFRRELTSGLLCGLGGGLLGGLIGGFTFGLQGGLIGGVVGGLISGLTRGDLHEVTAAASIRSDLLAWLAFGLLGGLAVGLTMALVGGLAYGLRGGLAAGLTFGLTVGLPFGLTFGLTLGFGTVWMRYALGVLSAVSRDSLPLRLVRFLDWGTRQGILRRSGSAYQFRHLSLRDHLQGSSLKS